MKTKSVKAVVEQPKRVARGSLRRMVQWLVCKIMGHKWDEAALHYVGMAYCERCGYEQPCGPTEPWTLANWLWWKRVKLSGWLYRTKLKVRGWLPRRDDDVPF
jgi:hypothetical protein